MPSTLKQAENVIFPRKQNNSSYNSELSDANKFAGDGRHEYDVEYSVEHQFLPSAIQIPKNNV